MPRTPWTLALVTGLARVQPALAHDGEPYAYDLRVHPAEPGRVFVHTTYGVVSTEDDGATWSWSCEGALGLQPGDAAPALSWQPSGRLLAGTEAGLVSTTDGGCTWSRVPGIPELYWRSIADDGAGRLWALANVPLDHWAFDTVLWTSTDQGATWTEAPSETPEDFRPRMLVAAPDGRIWIAGDDGPEGERVPALLRTDDGQTWERRPLPHTGTVSTSELFLATDAPDRLWLVQRQAIVEGVGGSVWFSEDGGDTFEAAWSTPDELRWADVAPDGAHLAVGSPQAGLHVVDTSDGEPAKVPLVWVDCVVWTDEALYVCSDTLLDGATVVRSFDGGASVEPFTYVDGACAPLDCPVGSTSEAVCEPTWEDTRARLGGLPECEGPVTDPPSGGCRTRSGAWLPLLLLLRPRTRRFRCR